MPKFGTVYGTVTETQYAELKKQKAELLNYQTSIAQHGAIADWLFGNVLKNNLTTKGNDLIPWGVDMVVLGGSDGSQAYLYSLAAQQKYFNPKNIQIVSIENNNALSAFCNQGRIFLDLTDKDYLERTFKRHLEFSKIFKICKPEEQNNYQALLRQYEFLKQALEYNRRYIDFYKVDPQIKECIDFQYGNDLQKFKPRYGNQKVYVLSNILPLIITNQGQNAVKNMIQKIINQYDGVSPTYIVLGNQDSDKIQKGDPYKIKQLLESNNFTALPVPKQKIVSVKLNKDPNNEFCIWQYHPPQ